MPPLLPDHGAVRMQRRGHAASGGYNGGAATSRPPLAAKPARHVQAPPRQAAPSYSPAAAQEQDVPLGGANEELDEVDALAAAGAFEGAEHMMTGTVKTWKEEKGYGFIRADGGEEDIFVHKSVLADGESLVEGHAVMLDLTYDVERKAFKATKVLGAVPALLSMEEAEWAVAEGDFDVEKLLSQGRDQGKDGKGGKKGKGKSGGHEYYSDPFYRPSFVEDPWTHLYDQVPGGEHLKAHLSKDGTAAEEEPKRKGGSKGKGKGKDKDQDKARGKRKEAETATQALPEPATKKQASSESITAEKEAPKEEIKSTSIYDFFDDEGGLNI